MSAVLTVPEARRIGLHLIDSFAFAKAIEADRDGRPAYFSGHFYHDQVSSNAAPLANITDLEFACCYVARRIHTMPEAESVGAFLDQIHPANNAAAAALESARSRWCAKAEWANALIAAE